jgi:hypothetical protein
LREGVRHQSLSPGVVFFLVSSISIGFRFSVATALCARDVYTIYIMYSCCYCRCWIAVSCCIVRSQEIYKYGTCHIFLFRKVHACHIFLGQLFRSLPAACLRVIFHINAALLLCDVLLVGNSALTNSVDRWLLWKPVVGGISVLGRLSAGGNRAENYKVHLLSLFLVYSHTVHFI